MRSDTMFRAFGNIAKVCVYGLIILTGVTFAVSNRGKVDLTFYPVPWIISMPLFIFAIAVFVVGLFMGWSIARFKAGGHKRAAKQANRRAVALENELGALRTERLITPSPVVALASK